MALNAPAPGSFGIGCAENAYKIFRSLNIEGATLVDEMNTIPFFTAFYGKKNETILLSYQLARIVWFYQMVFPLSLIGFLIEPLYLRLISKRYSLILTESMSTKKELIKFGFRDSKVKVFPVGTDIKPLGNIKEKEGVSKKYLSYHFEGFPAIASIAKITSMQNDVQATEQDIYNALIGNTIAQAASLKNFQAMVILEKNVFFEGETVKGRVVLGKYDSNTVPTSFSGPGKIENGQAVISMTAGGVGEKTINGTFSFMEDGKSVPLKFEGKYVVVPRPNSANISTIKAASV